jgi:hypothetical protein
LLWDSKGGTTTPDLSGYVGICGLGGVRPPDQREMIPVSVMSQESSHSGNGSNLPPSYQQDDLQWVVCALSSCKEL